MPRWNSLFVRLLVAQIITALAVLALFGGLFYIERSRTIARLTAERWAPALREAAQGGPPRAPLQPRYRQADLPPQAIGGQQRVPRVAELLQTLRTRGVAAAEVAFSPGTPDPVVWIAVPAPSGQRVWLGFVDGFVEARLPLRLVAGIVLGMLAIVVVSGVLARRLSRPLETLRRRMQSHAPDGPDAPRAQDADDSEPPRHATAEITAIDSAWRALRERLARHDRERQLLLAGVSHDLRSPLARIRMAAELLPDTPDAPAIRTRRDTIVHNTEVADRLIESFLDHVRAGELPLDEAVDVADIARGVVAALGRPAHELALLSPPALPLPGSNRLLLERLLQNLLDNALVHGRPPVRLLLSRQGHEGLRIEVEDAGAGIPPDRREHLMQAFARGDASRHVPGAGLGLAVVQRIVDRMGGTLLLGTHDGRHRACVELPARPPPAR